MLSTRLITLIETLTILDISKQNSTTVLLYIALFLKSFDNSLNYEATFILNKNRTNTKAKKRQKILKTSLTYYNSTVLIKNKKKHINLLKTFQEKPFTAIY